MWRRWRAELEQTPRESDGRHAEWQVEHAAFLAEQRRRFTLRDIRDGIRANTQSLLRVLDEMRRDDGPSAAGA